MEPQALLRHLRGERGGMRPVAIAALDGFVGNEPGVAAAAPPAPRGRPALDVRRILIRHPHGLAVQPGPPRGREVKDELVAVVHEPVAVDRLVVPHGHVTTETRARAGGVVIDRDRLHPVNGVLQLEVAPGHLRHLERHPGIGRFGANVQEQGAARGHRTGDGAQPPVRPVQVVGAGQVVAIAAVPDAQVVGRGGHDDANRPAVEGGEHRQRIAAIEPQPRRADGQLHRRPKRARSQEGERHASSFSAERRGKYSSAIDEGRPGPRTGAPGSYEAWNEEPRKPWATRVALSGWLR